MIPPRRRPLLSLLCLLPLTGCEQEPIIARSQRGAVTVLQGTVGPRGARIQGDDVEVDIPAGALPADTTISVQKIPRGGSSPLSLRPTALAVPGGCAQLQPQGAYLYALEPQSLTFSRDVRVAISTFGSGGVTALTLEGASTSANGYAPAGQKASVLLRDFSAAIDVQTLTPGPGAASYSVACDATSCTATSSAGQPTTCAPHESGFYRCQGPLGLPALATASSLAELKSLMVAVAIGQGSSCASKPPPPTCGNGALDAGEQCDGQVPAAQTCASALAPGATGTLGCKADCTLDTAGCQLPPGCTDGQLNGTETDTDCGGTACPACDNGRKCLVPGDCASFTCDSGVCKPAPTCVDTIKNSDETDVDCGGSCPTKCAETQGCVANADCASKNCKGVVCGPAPTCADSEKNGDETDQDCGGSCPKCAPDRACLLPADCQSGVCTGNVCQPPTCADGVMNGAETAIDCGGSCNGCAADQACGSGVDCQSKVCTSGACAAPTCTDGQKNGGETDTDCGGSCTDSKCADNLGCAAKADCQSDVCTGNVCQAPTCSDGARNGAETDIDCGGSECTAKCANNLKCAANGDCASDFCLGGTCTLPACNDGTKNGTETDQDCGGDCPACGQDQACGSPADCQSEVCTGNVCQPPTCADGVMNGAETAIDCGGSCNGCATDQACGSGVDCQSKVCTSGACAAPTCTDGQKNGGETDTDCGGSCTDSKCADNLGCAAKADCQSDVCTGNVCQPPTCADGVQNGTETDQDCGGSCTGCSLGQACVAKADCAGGFCLAGACVEGTRVFITSDAFAANFGSALAADNLCQTIATSAGLGGNWLSWTSDATTSPAQRFNTSTTAPYKLLDGTFLANGWNGLIGGIAHGITLDEKGGDHGIVEVWTGTSEAGQNLTATYGSSCMGWTSTDPAQIAAVGVTYPSGMGWSSEIAQTCERIIHLYCFEQ